MTASALGHAIRAARESRGWTQADLARELGPDALGRMATVQTVSRWERGCQIPERRLRDILRALDSVDLLLIYARSK